MEDDAMTTFRRIRRGAWIPLLAGLLLMAGQVPPLAAQPADPCPADFIPDDCGGFITVRLADLMDKFDTQEFPPVLFHSLPYTDVKSLTAIRWPDDSEPVFIVEGTKPLSRKSFQAGEGVHFVNDRLVLKGKNDLIKRCLARCLDALGGPGLVKALPQGGKHDLVVWVRPSVFPKEINLSQLGIESGLVTLDVGEKVNAEVCVRCTDEDRARKAEKSLHACIDVIRGSLLSVCALPDVCELIPDLGPDEVALRSFPLELFRKAEKSLQHAKIQRDGAAVTVTASLPVDAKTLRFEYEQALRKLGVEANDLESFPLPLLGMETRVSGMTLPSGRYLEHPPQYIPPEPTFPLPKEPASSTTVPVACSEAPRSVQQTAMLKLTIANVRKETALLFSMAEDGKLTFVQKLPPGNAVDVKTTGDTRWVAVFPDKQEGLSFDPKQAEATWLLR
jgi:hypothetical protein